MNPELEALARDIGLNDAHHSRLRLAFGHACVQRVSQNLENDEAIAGLAEFGRYLRQEVDEPAFAALAQRLQTIAQQHGGSRSLDGSQHAAVSATYALARAVAGRALEAAAYAAYSRVYGYGGYAVSDPDAFTEEFQAQVQLLRELSVRPRSA